MEVNKTIEMNVFVFEKTRKSDGKFFNTYRATLNGKDYYDLKFSNDCGLRPVYGGTLTTDVSNLEFCKSEFSYILVKNDSYTYKKYVKKVDENGKEKETTKQEGSLPF